MDLSRDELMVRISYDQQTGIFRWKTPPRRNRWNLKIGDIAGCVAGHGYRFITINQHRYYAGRLAFLFVYGRWPEPMIDHINGVKDDDRIENLREVTSRENGQNLRKHRDGKLVGATFRSRGYKNPWQSSIKVLGQSIFLGDFATEYEAHEAYVVAVVEYGVA